jgi:hypothetical protein
MSARPTPWTRYRRVEQESILPSRGRRRASFNRGATTRTTGTPDRLQVREPWHRCAPFRALLADDDLDLGISAGWQASVTRK